MSWRERLEEAWEHVRDPYWRLDHPEVTVILVSIISGVIGLAFALLQAHLLHGGGTDA
jgi:hypothetical protein